MSFSKIFGGKKKEQAPSTGEAIQRLRQTEEMLNKKQDFLEKKITEELKTARNKGTKDKRAALNALKRKKRLEKQLQQIDGTLSTIEFQREALENANTNSEVLKTMGYAAKALKNAHQHLDVDDVHDLMDDISESMDVSNEISEAISTQPAFDTVDEDELLAELEELEQEELDEKLLDVGPSVSDRLPDVPSEAPAHREKAKKVDDDDDMAELAAWAS
ncbi:charged multivesicular body protein 4b-like [Anneissia japonica]|uniref:charged multivesicular body protein 4b-like n=1 Tax=Anneissia japonica TaxID=1529436 RepID=UPI0014257D7F|nr:charged multivesicular body protein 4b-like [Anneissia japonica]XP_033116280.1 charged multivesicular body protein 4b-like [Anneissia japonica]